MLTTLQPVIRLSPRPGFSWRAGCRRSGRRSSGLSVPPFPRVFPSPLLVPFVLGHAIPLASWAAQTNTDRHPTQAAIPPPLLFSTCTPICAPRPWCRYSFLLPSFVQLSFPSFDRKLASTFYHPPFFFNSFRLSCRATPVTHGPGLEFSIANRF